MVGGPKFRVFCFPLPPQFSFFLPSSWGSSRGIWLCLKRWNPQMCTFGEPNVHIGGFQKHHQNSTKRPTEQRTHPKARPKLSLTTTIEQVNTPTKMQEHIYKHDQNTKTSISGQMLSQHQNTNSGQCSLAKCGHEKQLAECGFFGQMRFWPSAVMTAKSRTIADKSRIPDKFTRSASK